MALISSEFTVCEPVQADTCFHLHLQSQRLRLRALLNDLHVQPVPAASGSDFWVEVFDWLTKYADHEPDWADGCIAVLSGRYRDAKIWTYDRSIDQDRCSGDGRHEQLRAARQLHVWLLG
jgi:hypothetical protein